MKLKLKSRLKAVILISTSSISLMSLYVNDMGLYGSLNRKIMFSLCGQLAAMIPISHIMIGGYNLYKPNKFCTARFVLGSFIPLFLLPIYSRFDMNAGFIGNVFADFSRFLFGKVDICVMVLINVAYLTFIYCLVEGKLKKIKKFVNNFVFENIQFVDDEQYDDTVSLPQLPTLNFATNREFGKINKIFEEFNVRANVIDKKESASVIQYKIQLGQAQKVNQLKALENEIALKLNVSNVKFTQNNNGLIMTINKAQSDSIRFFDLVNEPKFRQASYTSFLLGKDTNNDTIMIDIQELPHLLIAGTTGGGKSICINTLICSVLLKATPDEVKFIMIDPKAVELEYYEEIPHLLMPVVTKPDEAINALNKAIDIMEYRYHDVFTKMKVRDIIGYNDKIKSNNGSDSDLMHNIFIIIDEYGDLMLSHAKELEPLILKLAQKARAAGIHLIVSTQRPSKDVITGDIKTNLRPKIALAVGTQADSKVILDEIGAEKLRGKGDMYFKNGEKIRVQGAFIDDKAGEVDKVVNHVINLYGSYKPVAVKSMPSKQSNYPQEHAKMPSKLSFDELMNGSGIDFFNNSNSNTSNEPNEPMIPQSNKMFKDSLTETIIVDTIKDGMANPSDPKRGTISASAIQRDYKVGGGRSTKIMAEISSLGILGESSNNNPRKILIDLNQWEQIKKAM